MEKTFNKNGRKSRAKRRFSGLKTGFSLIIILTVLVAASKLIREEALRVPESGKTPEAYNTPVIYDAPKVTAAQQTDEKTQPKVEAAEKYENKTEGTMEAPWYLILVNRDNPVPEDYELRLTELDNGESVNKLIYPDLQKMFDDMRAEGVYPVVCSGYRTREVQQRLYDEEVKKYVRQGYTAQEAEELAKTWVAIPGTSEHEIGISVDINAMDERSTDQQVYEWLGQNSYKYGFILRYPQDKTDITGISHEPWHFRYVGKEAAEEIYTKGLCLEEYLGTKTLQP